MFMGGISITKIFSVAGGAANIYDYDFLVDNDTIIEIDHMRGDAMFTPQIALNAKGGMGLDLGFTYQKMLGDASSYYPNSPKMGCRELRYKYKLGLSIIDIGNVKFPEGGYVFTGYDFNDFSWLRYKDTEVNENNPADLYEAQEPDITTGETKRPNKISLPTFISAQFDYNLWASRIYINGTIIQGIPHRKKKFGLRHANSLSITPRFESYWFDFALPFSLYEYIHPQLGASVRLGPITIGTDKLINWIFTSNIYGADIYVYLKLPIRYHPSCKDRKKRSRSRYKDNSPTKCTI